MLNYLFVFLFGVLTCRFLQIMLSIMPNYYMYKHTEYTIFRVIADLHVQRLTALKIIELCYIEAGKEEEYKTVELAVNKRYDDIINKYIATIKNMLPYKTNYNNLSEAMTTLLEEMKR